MQKLKEKEKLDLLKKIPVKKIGIFDSGIGGLTILNALMKKFQADYLYLADTAYMPYGNKEDNVIYERILTILNYFKSREVDAIIIACNTACSILNERRIENPIPVFSIIEPLISLTMSELPKSNTIAILGTEITVKHGSHKKLLEMANNNLTVIEQTCPGLARAIETNDLPLIDHLLFTYLNPLKKLNPSVVLLACTHYAHIKTKIKTYLPETKIISLEENIDPLITSFTALQTQSSLKLLITGVPFISVFPEFDPVFSPQSRVTL